MLESSYNRNIKNRLGLVFDLIRPNPTKSGVKKLKLLWTIGRSKLRNPPAQLCIASSPAKAGQTDQASLRSDLFHPLRGGIPASQNPTPDLSAEALAKAETQNLKQFLISRAFRRFLWTRRIETAPIKSNRKFLKPWPTKT